MGAFANKVLLFPYYLVLKIRNRLYDKEKIKSVKYDIPVISVGNVTVGGTGKTPHTELLVRELLKTSRVAVISRGYGRKGRGLVFVNEYDKASKVGDEPLQIKRKFPEATVVVDKDRRRAMDAIMAMPEEVRPEVVVMDDGHQYRKIVPSRSIVLISYSRPIFKDSLLPFGRLRDLPEEIRRADTVIISKCPGYLNEWDKEKCRTVNRIRQDQRLYFTTIDYLNPLPVYKTAGNARFIYSQAVLLVTGIADSKPLKKLILTRYRDVVHMSFKDHHKFTKGDIRAILRLARRYPRSLILTTEKDAQRFVFDTSFPSSIKERMFYIPISVSLVNGEGSPEDIAKSK